MKVILFAESRVNYHLLFSKYMVAVSFTECLSNTCIAEGDKSGFIVPVLLMMYLSPLAIRCGSYSTVKPRLPAVQRYSTPAITEASNKRLSVRLLESDVIVLYFFFCVRPDILKGFFPSVITFVYPCSFSIRCLCMKLTMHQLWNNVANPLNRKCDLFKKHHSWTRSKV